MALRRMCIGSDEMKCKDCRDCPACIRVRAKHGSCESIASWHCRCDARRTLIDKKTTNDQSVLRTGSTDRVRLAYWREWLARQAKD